MMARLMGKETSNAGRLSIVEPAGPPSVARRKKIGGRLGRAGPGPAGGLQQRVQRASQPHSGSKPNTARVDDPTHNPTHVTGSPGSKADQGKRISCSVFPIPPVSPEHGREAEPGAGCDRAKNGSTLPCALRKGLALHQRQHTAPRWPWPASDRCR